MLISIFTVLQFFSAHAADGEYTPEQYKLECMNDEAKCRAMTSCWQQRSRNQASVDSEKVCECEVRNVDKVTDKRKLNAMIELRRTQASEARKFFEGMLRGAKVDIGRLTNAYANSVAPKCEKDPLYDVPADDKKLTELNEVIVIDKSRATLGTPGTGAQDAALVNDTPIDN